MHTGTTSEDDRQPSCSNRAVMRRAASSLIALVIATTTPTAEARAVTGSLTEYPAAIAAMQGAGGATPAEEPPQRAEPQATLLSLPVIVDGGRAPDATVALAGDRATGVVASEIAQSLSGLVSAELVERIAARGAQLISIEELAATGLAVRFDAATLSLVIDVPVALRRAQSFSALGDNQFPGLPRVLPEDFAAGLTGSLFLADDLGGARPVSSRLALSGFVNVGGVRGFNLIYGGELALSGNEGSRSFQRDRLILFRDDPERAIRYSAGDLAPRQNRFLGQFDLLGFGVERSYADIQPLRNIRPTGRSAFTLERESLVEVYSNGALIRSFRAGPGPIELRDILSGAVTSDISIFVEDSLGRREIDSFTLANDFVLLDSGLSEFSFSVGVLRDPGSFGWRYGDDFIGSAYYARGLSGGRTLAGFALVSEAVQSAGSSFAFPLLSGVAQIEAAASRADGAGFGGAVGFAYRGDPFGLADRNGNLNVQIDYQTRDYRRLENFSIADDLKLEARIDYRFDLDDRTTLALGANRFERYRANSAETGVFAGVTRRIGRMTVSLFGRHFERSSGRSETGVLATLSVPIGRSHLASASYDSINNSARAELRRRRTLDLTEFEYGVRAESGERGDLVGGNVGFANSRFSMAADVFTESGNGTQRRNFGTARLTTGIAFVDGRVAIGRDPGRGFTMVSRHASLEAPLEIRSGGAGRRLGRADAFGPAVIPVLAPYRPQELALGAVDAPPGYDLGPGEYAVFPGARSGLSIKVGSDSNRSVIGILVRADGSPVALTTGTLTPEGGGDPLPFFTNAQGRFVVGNLQAGRYLGAIDGQQGRFVVTAGERAGSLTEAGTIILENR